MLFALLVWISSWQASPNRSGSIVRADDQAVADTADPLKVVLIAGPKSHGPIGNGIHDYPWSVRLIKVMLDNSNVADRIAVEYHLDGWPADESTLDDADTILVISDGRDGDLYAEAPHLESAEHIAAIQRQIDRGCGFMTFHFSTFAPDAYADQILDWTGGYFDWETDGQREWYSAITTAEAEVTAATPEHPVLSGFSAFPMREEFYYNIRFAEEGVTPLLSVPSLEGREPDGRVVAWARERANGGRGFGTTGGHFYDNWQVAEFRKLILNAIVWTAGGEVPEGGVDARHYEHAEIMAALDGVEGTERAVLDDAPITALIITGAQHPAHVWQDTTPALQAALERDPRIEVSVSEDIECLRDDLSRYDLLLLNYCNWQQTGLSEASKRGLLDYLGEGGGLLLIHFSNGAFHFSLPGSEASDWPEYRTNICRRVWDHTPGLSGHDAYGEFDVEILDEEHAVTRGMETFRTTDELYFRQQGDQPIHVLARARSNVTGEWEPMAFVYDYGEARIFQTVLGHAAESIRNEGTSELISRAAAWVARREQIPNALRQPPAAEANSVSQTESILQEGHLGNALDARTGGAYVIGDEVFRHAPLTVECRAKLDSSSGFNILVANENKDSATHWELFTQAGDGHLAAFLPGMMPDHARSSVNVCDGQWHYLAMTYAADRVRLFVDGEVVADQAMERVSDETVPAALAIGRLVDGGIGCDGLIDEVRISRGIREVASIPSAAFEVDDETIALWRFDADMPRDTDQGDTLFLDETERHHAVFGQNQNVLDRTVSASDPPAESDDAEKPDHWGREVVGFDWTEDDSRDSRWQEMEIGPSLASIVQLPEGAVAKGLTIRLQQGDRTASVCYDTETMQTRAAWTGGFLQFDPARYGIIVSPRPQGEPIFVAKPGAAWPEHEVKYHGHYRHGERIVLDYAVDGVRIFETPSQVLIESNGETFATIVRTIVVAPRQAPLNMSLAAAESASFAVDGAEVVERDHEVWALIPPNDGPTRVTVVLTSTNVPQSSLADVATNSHETISLQRLMRGGPPLWGQTLTTHGTLGDGNAAYVVDTLTLPFDNPWKALMFIGGHDFFSNADAAVCTVHGDVWRVSGIDADLDELIWTRMASGLFQALGLKIIDDQVYVLGRDRITRLHDLNGDGEADFYESFHDGINTSTGGHDYVTCLETDSQGNFYYVHAVDGVVRVSADGSTSEVVATGLRNPNGMSVGPNDVITATPQEGEWTPASYLCWVLEGDHYGYRGPDVTDERPLGFDPPLCYFPRLMDNSSGGQVWVPEAGWGSRPGGELLHLSFGQCTLHSILYEPAFDDPTGIVGPWDTSTPGRRQAGAFTWPLSFDSGVMRGRFHPLGGQLYVSGMRGWVSSAAQDGCLHRVRYTGQPDHMPIAARSYANGLLLQFAAPLDAAAAQDVGRYRVERWDYQYRAEYGSPDLLPGREAGEGHESVELASATLLDGHRLFLEIPEMQPVNQLEIEASIRSADGTPLRFTYVHTLNFVPESRIDDSLLFRPQPQFALDAEIADRLQRGLLAQVHDPHTHQPIDAVVSRMAAWQSEAETARSLPITLAGWLQVDLTEDYQFRLEGQGEAALTLNGAEVIAAHGESFKDTEASVTLHQGWNPITVTVSAPDHAAGAVRILWRGADFGWEPLPPDRLWHDSADPLLVEATRHRDGRELFAEFRCHRCHGDPSQSLTEWDVARSGPELLGITERVQDEWLISWLLDPQAHRSQAAMPKLLNSDATNGRREAAHILAYLKTLTADGEPIETSNSSSVSDIEAGLALYESLSCIACHRFTAAHVDDEFDRISLQEEAWKFQPGQLAEFLTEPRRHHPATRMPDFQLSRDQARQLAAYLIDTATHERAVAIEPVGDPERGRQLFISLRCTACHSLGAEQEVAEPKVIPLAAESAARLACLIGSEEPAGDALSRRPRYLVGDTEQAALAQFLSNPDSAHSSESDTELANRLIKSLRCTACHDRDGERSPRSLILAEESELGLTPEIYPALTWTGERVHEEWLSAFFREQDRPPLRPWIQGRMPHWNMPGEIIAHGLALQHGVAATASVEVADADAQTDNHDRELIAIGERLTHSTALDCRQCHGMQGREPLGDERTLFARGLDFELVAERTRPEFFEAYVLNPPRFDPNVRMPRLSADGETTKVVEILEGNADRQFDAVWAFIQSLRRDSGE